MLTVDFERLELVRGERLLDLGSGGGRHAFEAMRRGARVTALDYSAADLKDVAATAGAMLEAGEISYDQWAGVANANALELPFADNTFDRVIVSEVLEHIWDDEQALHEISRVIRPGGRVAATVPTRWPERVSWALNWRYHDTPGGHVRIYRQPELVKKIEKAGFYYRGSHHAHAFHSPYWWLKCAYGLENTDAPPVKAYHDFLCGLIEKNPHWAAVTERALNPVLGKSVVLYGEKVSPTMSRWARAARQSGPYVGKASP
jgi:SAM-dependent methyltransferase